MESIRIIQVLGGLNIGGAENFVMNIYRNIDKTKIQFDFIVHDKKEGFYEKEVKELGGKIYRVSRYRVINHFKYKREWNEFFKKHHEYKIIHSHVRSTASIFLKIAKKYGLKTICHSHSTSNGSGLSSVVKNILQHKIPLYADYLFGCSKESAKWLYGKDLLNSNRCYIIKNAIDTKKFLYNEKVRNKVRRELNIDNKIVLAQIGRLSEVKNHIFTINLMKELIRINNNYFLIIVGSGSLKEKIESYILLNKLKDNIIILENRKDVNELLQATDIYLMPSLWEGLPLALVEAQAASLPCIISNNVLDGILINELVTKLDLNNIKSWINCIQGININNKRVNQYKKIVDSGFDIKENVKYLMDFYLKI